MLRMFFGGRNTMLRYFTFVVLYSTAIAAVLLTVPTGISWV
jgi:hypothetical protein